MTNGKYGHWMSCIKISFMCSSSFYNYVLILSNIWYNALVYQSLLCWAVDPIELRWHTCHLRFCLQTSQAMYTCGVEQCCYRTASLFNTQRHTDIYFVPGYVPHTQSGQKGPIMGIERHCRTCGQLLSLQQQTLQLGVLLSAQCRKLLAVNRDGNEKKLTLFQDLP